MFVAGCFEVIQLGEFGKSDGWELRALQMRNTVAVSTLQNRFCAYLRD